MRKGIQLHHASLQFLEGLEFRPEARLQERCGLQKGFHDGSDLEEAETGKVR
jgi:hypothetical protein